MGKKENPPTNEPASIPQFRMSAAPSALNNPREDVEDPIDFGVLGHKVRRLLELWIGVRGAREKTHALADRDVAQRVAGLQLDRLVMVQLAGANLWTTEVLHYGHIPSRLFGGSANARDRRAMRLMSAVREIQSKDIHARTD